ncbi:uncharacterized protein LOC142982780 [Anticarsia gemmatalis]|uniref:uncharacterized protein LOC142982780 n=1 Tax=Anticarsia gemmatalis TaxID=129554 RepID=UPI003F76BA5C
MRLKQREMRLMNREKRAIPKKSTENKHKKRSAEKTSNVRRPRNSNNNTVKFYSTVDELNEDTLKGSNISGTLKAKKMEPKTLPDQSRRSNTVDNSSRALHIDFNHPKIEHITDNKIDTDHENTIDVHHEQLTAVLGNQTQKTKDDDLSKIIVKELKTKEIIGDSNATVISNITFTSENDTLTAMAFIAGNLLNKLWNMEKDTSGYSMETEDMKQEKISDLLDLFKEPLNLRQEAFLKNALEQLSSAMDKNKDLKNVTICQTIQDATTLIDNFNKTDEEEPSAHAEEKPPCKHSEKEIKQNATIKAIVKLNNVLGLLRKFENVQQNLSQLEYGKDFSEIIGVFDNMTKANKSKNIKGVLTKEEVSSYNTFGNILDKITKLLIPKKNRKRVQNAMKGKNALLSNQNVKNEFLKMYNIDLTNMTLTEKDKLVLDYISHINNNPDCLLNKNNKADAKSLPSIEGNILLNLSEFFKIKSFTDLINLIQPKKQSDKPKTGEDRTEPEVVSTTAASKTGKDKSSRKSVKDNSNKLASTKEKLKAHLKVIIEDLIELQNAKGISPKGNFRIGDALPCIYNIMNAGKEALNQKHYDNKPDNIIDMFNELRHEMKADQTRRSGSIMVIRPKSAIVLERVIKNLAESSQRELRLKTRRVAGDTVPKSFDKIQALMNNIRNVSSMYKYTALFTDVSPADRVMLLKTLEKEVQIYIAALEGIKHSYRNITNLPADKFDEFATFILNSAQNITLNKKVISKVERKPILNEIEAGHRETKTVGFRKPFVAPSRNLGEDNLIISRNQIVNHIIRNRMQLYIKLKEAKGTPDIYHDIAKRVLFYLDNGNQDLAQELYKVLVTQKQQAGIPAVDVRPSGFGMRSPSLLGAAIQTTATRLKPLIQFEEPKILGDRVQWTDQDQLIKQLLNIKNMAA